MTSIIKDIYWTLKNELKQVLRDSGVMTIFIVAGVLYPLLYNGIYRNEAVYEIPVAVVDKSASAQSRRYIKKLDATPEVRVKYMANDMEEASKLFKERSINGIVLIPQDYHIKLANREQAHISIYNDMSSFLYYKNLMMAANYTMLDEMAVEYNHVALFNSGGGFSSFLLPALLILIIHQTLFFGIGMIAGTASEESIHHTQIPEHLYGKGIFRVVAGKAACYFSIYSFISVWALIVIPDIFGLPSIGNKITLILFIVPFLLATIFFSMAVSVFIKNRETGIISFLFVTLLLLFLSGFSWPASNMPQIWRWLSYIFPSTHGVQGYIKINSAAAELQHVRFEYVSLWIQAAVYSIFAALSLNFMVNRDLKRFKLNSEVPHNR